MRNAVAVVFASVALAVLAPGCGSHTGTAPIGSSLIGALTLSSDGRTISGRFKCGGRLGVKESATQVKLSYIPPAIRPGGGTCGMVPVSVRLRAALGARVLIDGVTRQRLTVVPS